MSARWSASPWPGAAWAAGWWAWDHRTTRSRWPSCARWPRSPGTDRRPSWWTWPRGRNADGLRAGCDRSCVAASPVRAVPVVPAAARSGVVPGPVDPGSARLLAAGGGVLRRPPSADPVPVVLAAVATGPALVVTPSVDEARLVGARLRRAGLTVAVVPRDWAAAAGGVDVVIGARAAAWAPMPVLGAVVVLDEHDEALQEERVPTWHARDVAVERARRAGVPFLLVSPVPSLAALARWADRLHVPSRNEERAGWPILEIVDRTQDEPWGRSLLSSALIRSLRDPSRTVVCVLNAPGKARRLACRSCRALQRCERCQAAVSQDPRRRVALCSLRDRAASGVPGLRLVGRGGPSSGGERAARRSGSRGWATGGRDHRRRPGRRTGGAAG